MCYKNGHLSHETESLKDSNKILIFFPKLPTPLLAAHLTYCLLNSWISIVIRRSKLLYLLLFVFIWRNTAKEVGPQAKHAPSLPCPLILMDLQILKRGGPSQTLDFTFLLVRTFFGYNPDPSHCNVIELWNGAQPAAFFVEWETASVSPKALRWATWAGLCEKRIENTLSFRSLSATQELSHCWS